MYRWRGYTMDHVPTARYLTCSLCGQHIELETANTDENGQAVHEDCYVAYIAAQGRILLSTIRGLFILRTISPGNKHEDTSLSH